MKLNFLLLTSVAALSSSALWAWEKPIPASQPLNTDGETEQYIYNVGANAYLLGANDWSTRASVSTTKGFKWKVAIADETIPYYTLTDYCEKVNGWRRMFVNSNTAIWVDNDGGANNATWTIAPGDGNKFQIGNDGVEGIFGVRQDIEADSRCYFSSAYEDETLSTEWYSVSPEEYEVCVAKAAIYDAAMALQAAIAEAKEKFPSLDLSAQEAVFANEASTIEELNAATEAVIAAAHQAEAEVALAAASVENPFDMTSSIDNPSFETGALGNWKSDGSGGDMGVKEVSNATYSIENADGAYVFNVWGRTPLNVYQKLTYMPKGIYALTSLYASDANNTGNLFANADTLAIKANEAGKTMANEGTLVFANTEEDITIGMVSSTWFKADNFRLALYGDKADAAQKYVESFVESLPNYEDETVTISVLETFNALVEEKKNVTTVEEAVASVADIKAGLESIYENIAAWNDYKAILVLAKTAATDENIDATAEAVMTLIDYVDMESEDIISARALTTAEIRAEIEKVEEMRKAAMQCLGDGSDFTYYLKNPEMDSKEGWNGNPVINSKCGEKYGLNADFDVYQEVENAPVGVYEISMQGFYREFRDDNADKVAWYNVFQDTEDARTYKGTHSPLSFVYLNDNKTAMNCVYDYAVAAEIDETTGKAISSYYGSGFSVDPYDKYVYPNTMANAATAFADGAYKVSAFGLVAKDGDKMRIGVKGHLGGSDWAIFDNFKLTFRAKNEKLIDQLISESLPKLTSEKVIGKDVREGIEAAKAAAQEATDAISKFNALAALYEMETKIETSAALFEKLATAVADLETALNNSEANEETKAAAAELLEQAASGADGAYTDAEAEAAIKLIENMITKLAVPAFIGSDEQPVDFTGLIKDAEMTGLSVSGSTYGGWSFTKEGVQNGPKYTNACEFWNGDATTMKFNIYQTIENIPAGTYELKADAGNSYNGQTPGTNGGRVYLYAQSGENTVIPSVAVEPQDNAATSTANYSVIFKVAEGEAVTLGFQTCGTLDARWFVCDNFTLTGYGAESSKTVSDDAMNSATSIQEINSEAAATPVVIFNLNGVKTNGLMKGINIVRMSDGSVRKIMVK